MKTDEQKEKEAKYFKFRYQNDVDFRARDIERRKNYYLKTRVIKRTNNGIPKAKDLARTRSWRTWYDMKRRVLVPSDKDHKYYSEISIDKRWMKFEEFYKDMGGRPIGLTLERTDNLKGYCKENCRWATRAEQTMNRRKHVEVANV